MDLQMNGKFNHLKAGPDDQINLIIWLRHLDLAFGRHATAIKHPITTHPPAI